MVKILALLAVLLAIAAWLRQRSPSRLLNAMTAALALMTLGAVVWMWYRPKMEDAHRLASIDRMEESMGFALGQAAARAHPEGGDVLVLLDGLPAQFPATGYGADLVKGLQAGFGPAKLNAVPVGYQPASDAEVTDIHLFWPRTGVPLEKINEWFAGHPGAVAVVAFAKVGIVPRGNELPQMPPLFLLQQPFTGDGSTAWLDWVRPGALEAVANTHSADYVAIAAPSSLADVFTNCCDLITPANVGQARERLAKGNP